jgi:hypothetical protein
VIRKRCIVVAEIDLICNLMAKYIILCCCSTYIPMKMCKGSYSRESEFYVSADNMNRRYLSLLIDCFYRHLLSISLLSVYFPQVIKACSVGTIKYSTAVSDIFNCQDWVQKILTYRIK